MHNIMRVVETVNSEALSEIRTRLSDLTLKGYHRRFLVNRMGSTGSTWLAKMLNSHPDVSCSHEAVIARAFPSPSHDNEDILRLISLLAEDSMHHAYKAAGDVGSVWLGHVINLPKDTFTTAMLLRHPARLLNSRLNVYRNEGIIPEVGAATRACVNELWGIDMSRYEAIDQIFLHDTFTFATQVFALGKVDLLIHLEQLNDPGYCRSTLNRLTGLDYEDNLLRHFIRRPVNRKADTHAAIRDILENFTDRQRTWYRLILKDVGPYLGYNLEDEEESLPIRQDTLPASIQHCPAPDLMAPATS